MRWRVARRILSYMYDRVHIRRGDSTRYPLQTPLYDEYYYK